MRFIVNVSEMLIPMLIAYPVTYSFISQYTKDTLSVTFIISGFFISLVLAAIPNYIDRLHYSTGNISSEVLFIVYPLAASLLVVLSSFYFKKVTRNGRP